MFSSISNCANKIHRYGQKNNVIKQYIKHKFTTRATILVCFYCIVTTWRLFHMLPSSETVDTTTKSMKTTTTSHWLVNTEVRYYNLSSNPLYHYEFRYQLSRNTSSNRLMLLLGGHKRACTDWWTFSVGRRILSALREADYSILSVCSSRSTFDANFPIEDNLDVIWIHKSFHAWINEVYYSRYYLYPQLYLYGVSRGSHFAGLLCRVLPVQAQILYIYPGYFEAMTAESKLDEDLKFRLTMDPQFASWYSFKYCHKGRSDGCIFHNDQMQANFFPVPPTYFVHVANDAKLTASDYISMISAIQQRAHQLGGRLLTDAKSLRLHTSFPPTPTPSYMQEHFYYWHHKPYASQLFYEHLRGFPKLPEQQQGEYKYQTFWCHKGDFTFFQRYPSIMKSWSDKEREEYLDYTNDIKTYHELITEEFCGDLSGQHAMISLDLDRPLAWLKEIDELRQKLRVQELISRPLRIWMYDKASIVPPLFKNHHQTANCSYNAYSNRMYLAESIVQDHFQNASIVQNPLMADYFLIPHDLYCFIFYHQLFANFTNEQFKAHVYNYSMNYFEPLLDIVRYQFPYWNMASQPGSNHLIVFVGGRNMGVLNNHVHLALQHVIQLGPTGIRQDLLRRHAAELYLHRNLSTIYRHEYDIVIPPFTPTELRSMDTKMHDWYQRKHILLFFAGALNHSLSSRSARSLLDKLFLQNQSIRVTIDKKEFSLIHLVNGYISTEAYVTAIESSIFALCPEGYSPWTPRIYEAINLGSIPLLLADGIVLPFERFIPWRSFSLKLNVTNMHRISSFIVGNYTTDFERSLLQKKEHLHRYKHAFHWLSKDTNDSDSNVFDYIQRELKCRRLEQIFGATSDVGSELSRRARQQVCSSYADVCPCPLPSVLAFDEYN